MKKNNIENLATAKDVKDYLNHLSKLKRSIQKPIELEIKGDLYNIMDANGNIVLSCTKKVYDMFQEL